MKIRALMSESPHTIGEHQPVGEALRRMREHHVRHLPVLDGARLVGLVSDRDVALAEMIGGKTHESLRVGDVMAPEPFSVTIDAEVVDVVATMAQRKIGSAVVLDGTKVAGIFTTTDALHLLLRHLVLDDLRLTL